MESNENEEIFSNIINSKIRKRREVNKKKQFINQIKSTFLNNFSKLLTILILLLLINVFI